MRLEKSVAVFIFLMVTLLITSICFAQPPGMPGAPDQAPIDGGLGITALAGAGYGLKKLLKKSTSSSK